MDQPLVAMGRDSAITRHSWARLNSLSGRQRGARTGLRNRSGAISSPVLLLFMVGQ